MSEKIFLQDGAFYYDLEGDTVIVQHPTGKWYYADKKTLKPFQIGSFESDETAFKAISDSINDLKGKEELDHENKTASSKK